MNRTTRHDARATLPMIRCGIYTRKSSEEGLEQEFNSLDAQREAAEAYIKSQAHEGWTAVTTRYDDGGFSGGNTERPALRRLLADIEAGQIDVVVCYKVDRLSRSLLDFADMMQLFENKRISFVSVTQQFNTATSMGRLILNVLLSFAQFEREIIGERTRDKIAASRRKGKWVGGNPILGYDVAERGGRLLVNEDEAVRVRAIFDLYLEHEALLPVVQELAARGWMGKRRTSKKGRVHGGLPFDRTSLHRLLTNVAYLGMTRYRDEVHPGEHAAIVDPGVFQRVQATLKRNGRSGGAGVRNEFGFLLKGMLRCRACDSSMTPSHTSRNGKRYRYYVCCAAQKKGWQTCPSRSIPAGKIERQVVEQIRCIGRDPALLDQVLARARQQEETRVAEPEAEQRTLVKELAHWDAEVRTLAAQIGTRPEESLSAVSRLAELQERTRAVETRAAQMREQVRLTRQQRIDTDEVREALTLFDPVWQALSPREQARVVALLVKAVDYDGAQGKLTIAFHPTGIQTLAEQLTQRAERKERLA